jgi:hypothetical protein
MFRAYKPPPHNASRDFINSAATVGGAALGAVPGIVAGNPQAAISGAEAGAGFGGMAAGLFGGGEQQEQRVGSGLGLGMVGLQNYYKDKKNYDEVQTKPGGKEPVTTTLKPMASSMMTTSPIPTDVMNEETNPSKWNYRGRPMMSKPIY